MPVANRYGLDVGNILSQASNIKTARLNRDANELALKEKQAGIKLREDYLDEQTGITKDEIPIDEKNRLMALAPDVAKDIQKNQQLASQQESLKKMYMSKGEPEEIAAYKSQLDVKDVMDFEKLYANKDKENQAQIRDNIAQQGRMIQSVLETAQNNPQQANQMYMNYKADSLKTINELRKNGRNKEADELETRMKRLPESLITPDGKFNAGFLTMSLAKLNSMLTTAESYQQQQQENMKQKNALALEKERQKRPSQRGTKKEFQQLLEQYNNPNTPQADKDMIKARLTKLSQSDMSSLKINIDTVNQAQTALASDLGLDSPYKLSTIDTRKLTPEQQAQANQTASIIVKGLGANAKQAEKKMGEFGAASEQMQNALAKYENVGNFRAVDEATKEYFSNYFGLSEKELESTEAAQAFQSLLNIKIKADSGSAVSGQEMVRNTLETATPYMSKDKIVSGIKNIARRYIGELKSLKRVMGPVAFNLKYGAVLSNYEDIANAADNQKSKKSNKLEELRKEKNPRQSAFNTIKRQRPNATTEQINAYLDSKGY